jgi:hypothetical protein
VAQIASILRPIKASRSVYIMLLSSVLSILDQSQITQNQPKTVQNTETDAVREPFTISASPESELAPDLKDLQTKQAAEAGLLRPILLVPGAPSTSLHDLIKAVAKFEKNDPKRVVDVFE